MRIYPTTVVPRTCINCGAILTSPAWRRSIACSQACYFAFVRLPEQIAARFWPKVDKESSPVGCWLWTGATCRKYGSFHVARRPQPAQRVAWELTHGPIGDPRVFVCHNCPGGDNPLCVNPAHMFLSNDKGNKEDAVRKGRMASGERQGLAVLTAAIVREGRALHAGGMSIRATAQHLGVNQGTLYSAISGKSWKYVV